MFVANCSDQNPLCCRCKGHNLACIFGQHEAAMDPPGLTQRRFLPFPLGCFFFFLLMFELKTGVMHRHKPNPAVLHPKAKLRLEFST